VTSEQTSTEQNAQAGDAIAVIGVGCLFPDAANLEQYWDNIQEGRDAIGPIPLTHWNPQDYFDEDPKKPDHTYAKTGGFLKPYPFDPLQFGLAPHALEATDSTQLLGMVAAHQAMIDAGYGPERNFDRDRVSCLLGVTGTLELVIPLGARLGHPIWKRALARAGVPDATAEQVMQEIAQAYVPWQENSFPGLLGNVVAGRIANRLDLGGSNSVVDAACASSLAAVHMAMMELRSRRADMVITGGMDTFNDIFMYMCFSKTPALSPSGQSRPFDADGDGTILGEGLGAIILKRLDDAIRDGDRIYAVIRGMGSSSDGKGQAIYAPSAKGQTKALERAYSEAGVSPRAIQLVEAHGTGTKVGDGVELDALTQVYRNADPHAVWCTLGSVKSQIGHTKAAAGAAGLIKCVMALYHKVLPPTLKVRQPHPKLESSPFEISPVARPWISPEGPRRAAVSAFGFGGSNYHCVLEEYKRERPGVVWDPDLHVVLFSAHSRSDLRAQLTDAQGSWTDADLRIISRRWRSSFRADAKYRLAWVSRGPEEYTQQWQAACEWLDAAEGRPIPKGLMVGDGPTEGRLAFIYAGQGSQQTHMLRDFVCRFPEGLEALEAADALLREQEGAQASLSRLIYPAQAFDAAQAKAQQEALTATRYAQMALGTLGLVSLKILKRFGIEADAHAGHSFGELLALYGADVWREEHLLQAAYQRGRLMSEKALPGGAMLAVMAPRDQVMRWLEQSGLDLSLANLNAPEQLVLGGSIDAIEAAQQQLKAQRISSKRLEVSSAFHTRFVSDAIPDFEEALVQLQWREAKAPVYSNTLASVYPVDVDAKRSLLAGQIGQAVRFSDMLASMATDGVQTFVEIGPGRKLQGIIKASLPTTAQVLALDSHGEQAVLGLAHLLVHLAVRGHKVNWSAWDPGPEELPKKKAFHVLISGANHRSTPVPAPLSVGDQARRRDALKSTVTSSDRVAAKETPRPHSDAQSAASQGHSPVGHSNLSVGHQSVRQPHWAQSSQSRVSRGAEVSESKAQVSSPEAAPKTSSLPPSEVFSPSSSFPRSSVQSSDEVTMSPSKPADLSKLEHLLREMQDIQRRTTDAHTLFLENQRQFQSLLQGVLFTDGASSAVERATVLPQARVEPRATVGDARSESEVPRMGASGDSVVKTSVAPLASEAGKPAPSVTASAPRPLLEKEASAKVSVPSVRSESAAVSVPSVRSEGAAVSVPSVRSEGAAVSKQILQVIAQATGYPSDLLGQEMELESDLGIDSIKKVEIFSQLQAQVPALEHADASQLNALQTIADIMALCNSSPAAAPASPGDERPGAWAAGQVAIAAKVETKQHQDILVLVAEKTGFPADMLHGDMDLEGDLGIDSIKKVEIFSSFQERFPQAAHLSADQLNQVRTIADLVGLLSEKDAAPAPEAVGPIAVSAPLSQDLVYRIISEKTGYPREVLSEGMDLESDLGIDSIKRVEIISTLTEQLPFLQDRPQEQLSDLKTLADVLQVCRVHEAGEEAQAAALLQPELVAHWDLSGKKKELGPESDRTPVLMQQPLESRGETDFQEFVSSLPLEVIPYQAQGQALSFGNHGEIWIVDDGSNLARNLMLKLQERGLQTRLVSLAMQDRLTIPEQLAGLFLIAPLKFDHQPLRWLQQAFRLLKRVGPSLIKHVGPSFVVTVTRHGGRFGLDGLSQSAQAYAGGVAALAKTVHREWPRVHARALDIGKDFTDGFEAALRVLETALLKGPVELGVQRGQLFRLQLQALRSGAQGQRHAESLLKAQDLILVTGGARGVTAASLLPLAERYHHHFVIWGRTPLASPSDDLLAGLDDPVAIKRELMQRDPQLQHPKALEQAYRLLMQQRELRENIEAIEAASGRVTYEVVDVSKDSDLRPAFQNLKERWGVPAGVIHGAGVIRDKLLIEQRDEEFAEVLETKLRLLPYLEELCLQGCRWIVLYSSSTARLGRKGQGAYGVANEVLNKFAHLAPHWGVQALALNWGPWDGGMVHDGLKKIFAAEGVGTIPLRSGALLLRDLLEKNTGLREWVVVAAGSEATVVEETPSQEEVLQLIPVSIDTTPVLIDHVLKHRAVVPAALLLEWMTASAHARCPEQRLLEVQDFQVWKGVVLDAGQHVDLQCNLLEQKVEHEQNILEVTLRSLGPKGLSRAHAHARLVFGTHLPPEQAPEHLFVIPEARLAEVQPYDEMLFHGEGLFLIEQILSADASGLWVRLRLKGQPEDWAKVGLETSWNVDAPLLDAIFQSAIVWSSLQLNLRCLPSRFEKLRCLRTIPPESTFLLQLTVLQQDAHRLQLQAYVFDEEGHRLWEMEHFEAVMDASLQRSFAEKDLTSSVASLER
jgi:acyl transferase domain-containing protein/NAD(P)-dependent dehydrogenase (short-subunit alcohol dehydrogenase family)